MFAATLSTFRGATSRADSTPEPPGRYRGPVFIGDAVVPWGAETLLLACLRHDAETEDANDQL